MSIPKTVNYKLVDLTQYVLLSNCCRFVVVSVVVVVDVNLIYRVVNVDSKDFEFKTFGFGAFNPLYIEFQLLLFLLLFGLLLM